jgi:hypothetical protein
MSEAPASVETKETLAFKPKAGIQERFLLYSEAKDAVFDPEKKLSVTNEQIDKVKDPRNLQFPSVELTAASRSERHEFWKQKGGSYEQQMKEWKENFLNGAQKGNRMEFCDKFFGLKGQPLKAEDIMNGYKMYNLDAEVQKYPEIAIQRFTMGIVTTIPYEEITKNMDTIKWLAGKFFGTNITNEFLAQTIDMTSKLLQQEGPNIIDKQLKQNPSYNNLSAEEQNLFKEFNRLRNADYRSSSKPAAKPEEATPEPTPKQEPAKPAKKPEDVPAKKEEDKKKKDEDEEEDETREEALKRFRTYETKQEWYPEPPAGQKERYKDTPHDIGHHDRVILWANYLYKRLVDEQIIPKDEHAREGILLAASVHDVWRYNDGRDPDHAKRAAMWLRESHDQFPGVDETVLEDAEFLVRYHDSPSVPRDANDMRKMMLYILEGADALERSRFNESGRLDPHKLPKDMPAILKQIIIDQESIADAYYAAYERRKKVPEYANDPMKNAVDSAFEVGILKKQAVTK